jgi:hypothetical protein
VVRTKKNATEETSVAFLFLHWAYDAYPLARSCLMDRLIAQPLYQQT